MGERDAGMEKNLSVTDQSFEWEKTYYYRVTTLHGDRAAGKAGSVDRR